MDKVISLSVEIQILTLKDCLVWPLSYMKNMYKSDFKEIFPHSVPGTKLQRNVYNKDDIR